MLATSEGHRGAALFDFTDNQHVALIHGNELLEVIDPKYPTQQRYRALEHTVVAVLKILSLPLVRVPDRAKWALPEGVTDAFGVFVGYLLLDAWIGNTDRHHENWGLLLRRQREDAALFLAPSYDHASSLGRELSDEYRTRQVRPAQGSRVEHYARRAKSAFYSGEGEPEPLPTWEVFKAAAAHRPSAGEAWLARLRELPDEAVNAIVEAVPESHMSRIAKDFACALLRCNAKLVGAR